MISCDRKSFELNQQIFKMESFNVFFVTLFPSILHQELEQQQQQ